MREPVPESLILHKKNSFAELYYNQDLQLALIVSTTTFLPVEEFKSIFFNVTELVKSYRLSRILFDKRSLTVFHQPSMEWYYLDWKVNLHANEGVKEHAKILPKDDLFRKSVEEARDKIFKDNPTPPVQGVKIQYFNDFPEALESFSTLP